MVGVSVAAVISTATVAKAALVTGLLVIFAMD